MLHSMRKRLRSLVAVAALGGGIFALNGCDPNVRDTVMSGVSSAATTLAGTFIQAFMDSLNNGDPNSSGPQTVQARDATPSYFG